MRRNGRRARTQQKIIEAARNLIDGKGATSVRAIAREAGVSTGTIYTYFGSADEVRAEAYGASAQSNWDAKEPARHEIWTSPSREGFRRYVAAWVQEQLQLADQHPTFPSDATLRAGRRSMGPTACRAMNDLFGQVGSEIASRDHAAYILVYGTSSLLRYTLEHDPERLEEESFVHEIADSIWYYISSPRTDESSPKPIQETP